MEEEGKSGSSSSHTKIVMMNSSTTTQLDFARSIPKSVVLVSAFIVSCTLLYYASSNNFGQLFPTSLSKRFPSLYGMNGTPSSSNYIDVELVDEKYIELRKVLKAASMEKDKTVILTTLNDAWAEPNSIFDIFLEGFRVGNNTQRLLNHLLVIAVDEKAYSRCMETVTHCYFFKSKKYSKEMASEAKFMSPVYLEMMWDRLDFLQTILSLGHSFVFTDTDIMWLRDPFPHFLPNMDFQTSCDRFNGRQFDMNNPPNNGFLFVRSNPRTIDFYKFWVASRWTYPGLHEQAVFDKIKFNPIIDYLGLKIRFLDTDWFSGFCKTSRDFNKVVTMHANCCVGLDRKIADLKTTLEDWKNYVSSLSSNQTRSQQSHWRVPSQCRM